MFLCFPQCPLVFAGCSVYPGITSSSSSFASLIGVKVLLPITTKCATELSKQRHCTRKTGGGVPADGMATVIHRVHRGEDRAVHSRADRGCDRCRFRPPSHLPIVPTIPPSRLFRPCLHMMPRLLPLAFLFLSVTLSAFLLPSSQSSAR